MYHIADNCMQIKKSNKYKIINEPWWAVECQNPQRVEQYHLRLFRNYHTPQSLKQYKETIFFLNVSVSVKKEKN